MQPVVHSTFTLDRHYPAAPARIFRAFADPARKRRWFLEGGGNQVDLHEMDFRVGGTERACFRHQGSPVAGIPFTCENAFLDIVADHRIVFASTMAMGDARISASLVTVEIAPDAGGTRLTLTHQGAFFEGADGPEMRQEGWRKLLDRLADHAEQAA
jgi:uncharacterized protein YndB with AHSA1/START domain